MRMPRTLFVLTLAGIVLDLGYFLVIGLLHR